MITMKLKKEGLMGIRNSVFEEGRTKLFVSRTYGSYGVNHVCCLYTSKMKYDLLCIEAMSNKGRRDILCLTNRK